MLTNHNVIMIHIGRSGSTVLSDMLHQHSKISWDGEIYEKLISNYEKKNGPVQSADISLRPYRLIKERILHKKKIVYGFEVKFYHLDFVKVALKDYINTINQFGVSKIIILKRKNFLRKIVSSLIARKTGVWFKFANNKSTNTESKKIYIDVNSINIDRMEASLIHFLNLYDSNFSELFDLTVNQDFLSLEYESDIQSNPHNGYRKVINFLNLDDDEPTVRLSRTNPESLDLIIENYDEVRKYLSGTKYSWMAEG